MPKWMKSKVLVIGSGNRYWTGCRFDYAGTQACRSLKEEGIKLVLINSILLPL
ncbi:MAG: hypothetical protein ACLSD6_10200 [Clostridium sp.]